MKMNTKNLIAAVAVFAAAGSAFADQTYPFVEHTNIASTKTRAEVAATVAPVQAARPEFVEHTKVAGEKTRAEVRAELADAHDVAHAPEFVEFTDVASTRSRDEVRKEAIQAAQNTR
jgi:hypothetical protein